MPRGSISLYQGCRGKVHSVAELEELERSGRWVAEPKFDGIWICVSSIGGPTEFISRTGMRKQLSLPALPPETVLIGEAAYGSQTGKRRREDAGHDVIDVFDILQYKGVYLKDKPRSVRQLALNTLFIEHKELAKHYQQTPTWTRDLVARYIEQSEGLILKPIDDGPYIGGKVDHWLKAKKHPTNDYVILGSTTSTAETKDGMARNIICGGWVPASTVEGNDRIYEADGEMRLVDLVKVGSMTHAMAEAFENGLPRYMRMVVEVAHYGLFESGACRHPSLVRLRSDKLGSECMYRI